MAPSPGPITPLNLCSPKVVRRLLAKHQVTPSRGRGQNFLIDRNVLERTIELANLSPDDTVLDLGSGLGLVAGSVAPSVKRVIAFEIDPRLVAAARAGHEYLQNIEWLQADLRRQRFADHFPPPGEPVKVVANLPYSLSKLLLRSLLTHASRLTCSIVMIQREVADRLTAAPGCRDYGLLAVASALYARVRPAFLVSPGCFLPRPKVDSAVVCLDPPPPGALPPDDIEAVMSLVRDAFSQRRKTLVNAVSAAHRWGDAERIQTALAACGLDRRVRAEAVTPGDFVALHRRLQQ